MTSMSIADGDRDYITHNLAQLLLRRRQMAPLTLTSEDTNRLYIPAEVADTLAALDKRGYDLGPLLQTSREMTVRGPSLVAGYTVRVQLRAPTRDFLYSWTRDTPAILTSPGYGTFFEWLVVAVRVQAVNDKVTELVRVLMRDVTTYKQLYKALPETLAAVNAQGLASSKSYVYSRPYNKLTEVYAELSKDGASRARALSSKVNDVLKMHKTLIETTFATAVLLPDVQTMGEASNQPDTWLTLNKDKD